MVAILNVTKGKRKVIVSGLAGTLSALIFLTAIYIAAKIAIIVSAAAVTYLLLLLIHKIRTKAEITRVSEDEGEEKDTEIPVKEPKRTEAELAEELKNKRAQEHMKNGLGGPINALGELILVEIIDTGNSNPVDYKKTMVVPEKIILDMPDDKTLTQNSSIKNQIKSLPKHMDALGNPLPERPSANISIESKPERKLSPAEWLLQHGVNNDVREVLERPAKGFNGLGFNM